jgi:RND family efflux transporter MFP subunit
MKRLGQCGLPFVLLSLCLALTGCGHSPGQSAPPPQTPEVEVSLPVTREVTDYEDFPGRTEAIKMVEVRARASGYLEKWNFKEGDDVKEGDLLFEIDSRPYEAELARAEGNVVQSEGRLTRLEADFARAKTLLPKGAIGQEDYDRIAGDRTEAVGAVKVARANRELARQNLGYCRVVAPFSGRISRRSIDPGNLVKADETVLTVIVAQDPIYAYFDPDERTTLRLKRLIHEGKVKWSTDGGLPVLLGLADEEGFPRKGAIDFGDNRVDPDTGTWRLRGLFRNADNALTPGLFVRIRLPIGRPYQATLVAEQALSTDQGRRFVYVIDDAGKAKSMPVKVGRVHHGLRVITDGLAPTQRVVVNGLQYVRDGAVVVPKLVKMPAGPDADAKPGQADDKPNPEKGNKPSAG